MKNEFGHIIKKKVENSSLTPPPMDWKGLSNAQKNSTTASKSVFTSKLGITIFAFVSVAVITTLVYILVFKSEDIESESEKIFNENIELIDSAVSKSKEKEKSDTMQLPEITERETVSEEKKVVKPHIKKKKKDKFEPQSQKQKLKGDKKPKTESTTTILYEVDTVTTETYIYE